MTEDKGKKTWEQLGALQLCNVSISAKITNKKGHLVSAGKIPKKAMALALGAPSHSVNLFILAGKNSNGISESDETDDLKIEYANSLSAVINLIYEKHAPRIALCENAIRAFEHREYPGISLKNGDAINDYYVPLSLLNPIQGDVQHGGVFFFSDPDYVRIDRNDEWENPGPIEGKVCKIHSLEELLTGHQQEGEGLHLLLLGQNGSGKTEFLQHTAFLAAKNQLRYGDRNLLPVFIDLFHWEAWIKRKPLEKQKDVVAYLVKEYAHIKPEINDQLWRSWLNNGDVIFLIDNLNKIQDPAVLRAFQIIIENYYNCSMIVSCRTVNYENYKGFHKFAHYHLKSLDKVQQQKFFLAYYNYEENLALTTLELLQRLPGMRGAISNPRILSIVCSAPRHNGHKSLNLTTSVRKTDIFKRVVDYFIQEMPSSQSKGVLTQLDSADKLRVLESLAYDLLIEGIEPGDCFSRKDARDSIRRCMVEEGLYDEKQATNAALLLLKDLETTGDFLQQSTDAQKPCRFMHGSVQQYLAACQIVYMIEDPNLAGWDTPVASSCIFPPTIGGLIDRVVWQANQNEMICFLAGLLHFPRALLMRIIGPGKDDVFYHLRALATWCLLEVIPGDYPGFQNQVSSIADDMLPTWFGAPQSIEDSYYPKAVQALVQLNATYQGITLSAYIASQLRGLIEGGDISRLLDTLSLMRSFPIAPLISRCIKDLLVPEPTDINKTERMRYIGLYAIKALGPSAGDPNILEELVGLLPNSDGEFFELQALSEIGIAAKYNEGVIRVLSQLLKHDYEERLVNPIFQKRLLVDIDLIRRLGLVQKNEVLQIIRQILGDIKNHTELERCQAAYALAAVPQDGLGADNIALLLQEIPGFIFHGTDGSIRQKGIEAAMHLLRNTKELNIRQQIASWFIKKSSVWNQNMPQEHYSEFIDRLMNIFHDDDDEILIHKVKRIHHEMDSLSSEQLAQAAVMPELINQLVRGLELENVRLNELAKDILQRLAPVSKDGIILQHMIRIYRHGGSNEQRSRAASVLEYFGESAAREELLNAMEKRLRSHREDQQVILNTVKALRSMGKNAANHRGIMEALFGRINGSEVGLAEELVLTLAMLASVAKSNTSSPSRYEDPFKNFLDGLNMLKTTGFSPAVSIMHRQGMRFFISDKGNIQYEWLDELGKIR